MNEIPNFRTRRRMLQAVPAPSGGDKVRRFLWAVVEATAYRCSPTPLHAWRRVLLRLFGARIARGAAPYPTARIWAPWNLEMEEGSCIGPRAQCYSVGRISLGAGSIVSQGAHLCAATHDHLDPSFPLMVGDIRVGREAWVAADAFVGPGVTVGDRALVGARAVVVRDVEHDVVVAGNPARPVGTRNHVLR